MNVAVINVFAANSQVITRVLVTSSSFGLRQDVEGTSFVFAVLEAGETADVVSLSLETGSSVSVAQWRRVAHLARIAISEDEIAVLCVQLNSILSFVEQLGEVNVEGVDPMTSVTPMKLRLRQDEVSDGGDADKVLANAPQSEDGFFLVPKVVE